MTGRFGQGDPVVQPGQTVFGYASGNPVALLDSDGEAPVVAAGCGGATPSSVGLDGGEIDVRIRIGAPDTAPSDVRRGISSRFFMPADSKAKQVIRVDATPARPDLKLRWLQVYREVDLETGLPLSSDTDWRVDKDYDQVSRFLSSLHQQGEVTTRDLTDAMQKYASLPYYNGTVDTGAHATGRLVDAPERTVDKLVRRGVQSGQFEAVSVLVRENGDSNLAVIAIGWTITYSVDDQGGVHQSAHGSVLPSLPPAVQQALDSWSDNEGNDRYLLNDSTYLNEVNVDLKDWDAE